MFGFLKSLEKIVVFIKGKSYTVKSETPEYEKVQNALDASASVEEVEKIVDTTQTVKHAVASTSVKLQDGALIINGERVPEDCGLHARELKEKGILDQSFARFLERLMQNPDPEARKDLYSFILKGKMPITDDGRFCAYKVVRHDFKDKHTGTMENSPGKEVSMKREDCDSDRTRTCSRGLHFCSSSYISQFRSSTNDKVVMLLIDPKDVVSIPADYNDSKGRACFYKVVKEIDNDTLLDGIGKIDIPHEDLEKEHSKEAIGAVKFEKFCSTCTQTLPMECFSADKSRKDGKRYQCKSCTKAAKKKK